METYIWMVTILIVIMIFVLRFILNRAFDSVENAIGKKKNKVNGPQKQNLADLYGKNEKGASESGDKQ